jgi:hypothetical protein
MNQGRRRSRAPTSRMKRTTSIIQRNLIEVTKKWNVILVESINNIHELKIQIEKNHASPQEK